MVLTSVSVLIRCLKQFLCWKLNSFVSPTDDFWHQWSSCQHNEHIKYSCLIRIIIITASSLMQDEKRLVFIKTSLKLPYGNREWRKPFGWKIDSRHFLWIPSSASSSFSFVLVWDSIPLSIPGNITWNICLIFTLKSFFVVIRFEDYLSRFSPFFLFICLGSCLPCLLCVRKQVRRLDAGTSLSAKSKCQAFFKGSKSHADDKWCCPSREDKCFRMHNSSSADLLERETP